MFGGWHVVPRVFGLDIPSKAADRLEPRVALRHRRTLARPLDGRCRSHVGLAPLGGRPRETAQQIRRVHEVEAGGLTHREVSVNSLPHACTSGQGWATCLSNPMSTLA